MSRALLAVRRGDIAKPTAFSPMSLSPAVWLKADTLGLSDNAAVSSFTDSSGNGRHFVQATGGSQPVYKTAIQNGLGVVRFDGTDDTLAASVSPNMPSANTTVCMVMSLRSSTGFGMVYVHTETVTELRQTGAGGIMQVIYNLGSASDTVTASGFNVFGYALPTGSTGTLYKNGSAIAGSGTVSDFDSATLRLGGRSSGNNAAVDVGEFLLFSSVLGTTDRQSVESYLKAKWGTP